MASIQTGAALGVALLLSGALAATSLAGCEGRTRETSPAVASRARAPAAYDAPAVAEIDPLRRGFRVIEQFDVRGGHVPVLRRQRHPRTPVPSPRPGPHFSRRILLQVRGPQESHDMASMRPVRRVKCRRTLAH